MAISLAGPITGGAQTGFTTPGYTLTADKAIDVNSNQAIVSAVTGTQTGVRVHAISDPFTVAVSKPKNPSVLPSPNPVTGKYGNVPFNRTSIIVRKGVNFAANNAPLVAIGRVYLDIPAGGDAFDAANVRALCSALIGQLNGQSAGVGDAAVTGVI